MPGKVRAVPEGFHTITPHLNIRNCSKAIEFYQKAFGAEVKGVHRTPDGKVMHALLKIGDSQLMVSDEFPEMGAKSPESLGGSAVVLNVYVEDVDALFNRAVGAGAKVVMPLMDQFWGDRYGVLSDPFGHQWSLATHVRDMSADEMKAAGEAAMARMPKSA